MGNGGPGTGRARRADAGFTLIELMIVIVVLGILAGIVIFGVNPFRDDASAAACRADLRTLATANAAYVVHHGSDADDVDDLVNGGYLHSAPTSGVTFSHGETVPTSPEGCSAELASAGETTTTTAGGSTTSSTSATSTTSSTTTSSTTSSTTTSTTLAVTVALGSASGSAVRVGSTNAWNATLDVSVVDGGGQAVSGALVVGVWSDAVTPTSCTTGGSGSCSFTSAHSTPDTSTTRSWTVVTVTKAGALPGTNAVTKVTCKRTNASGGTHACTVS